MFIIIELHTFSENNSNTAHTVYNIICAYVYRCLAPFTGGPWNKALSLKAAPFLDSTLWDETQPPLISL